MLTGEEVHDLTGVPVSTVHDWAAKRERGVEAPGPITSDSVTDTVDGRGATRRRRSSLPAFEHLHMGGVCPATAMEEMASNALPANAIAPNLSVRCATMTVDN
jgi:hypothetical protein